MEIRIKKSKLVVQNSKFNTFAFEGFILEEKEMNYFVLKLFQDKMAHLFFIKREVVKSKSFFYNKHNFGFEIVKNK